MLRSVTAGVATSEQARLQLIMSFWQQRMSAEWFKRKIEYFHGKRWLKLIGKLMYLKLKQILRANIICSECVCVCVCVMLAIEMYVFTIYFYYPFMLKFLYCIFYVQHLNVHKISIHFCCCIISLNFDFKQPFNCLFTIQNRK